jgi:hypothetical protein
MMRPEAVYQYPIWTVALSLVVAAVIATMLLEIGVRRFVSADFRRQHNEIAAAIFSIIGVTYAVLLAFVAMLAWEGFNKAKAASHLEAVVIQGVFEAADGFGDPARANIIDRLTRYTRAVIGIEWRAQAEGRVDRSGDAYLDELISWRSVFSRPTRCTATFTHCFCNPLHGYATLGRRDYWRRKPRSLRLYGS